MALEPIGIEAVFEDIRFRNGLGKYNKAVDEANKRTQSSTTKMKSSWDNLGKFIAKAGFAVGITAATTAVRKFVADSTQEFRQFQSGMAEVFTLLPNLSADAMKKMGDDVRSLSIEMGRLPSEVIPALYESLSSDVPEDTVFDFLRVAHEAALGGVTTLDTVVDGLTSVINAYGADVITAAEASDLMFEAVKGGKLSFEELARKLSNVVPIAQSLGLAFMDVTAALATMTAQGVPAAQATTQLRQALVELSKGGTIASDAFQELTGTTFRDFIAQGGNLQEGLQILEQYAADTSVGINELFGSVEAGQAALLLTGRGTEKFTQELRNAENATGSTAEAAARMADTTQQAVNEAAAAWSDLKIAVGEAFDAVDASSAKARKGVFTFISSQISAQTVLESVQDTVAGQTASWYDLGAIMDDTANTFTEVSNAVKRGATNFADTEVDIERLRVRAEIFNKLWKEGVPQALELSGDALADLIDKFEALEPDVRARLMDEMIERFRKTGQITSEAAGDVSDFNLELLKQQRAHQDVTVAAEAQAQAIELVVNKTSEYFGQLIGGTEVQSAFNDLLIDHAIELGLAGEKVAQLAVETGEYTVVQSEAALVMAEASARAEELRGKVEEGAITQEEALELLRDEYGARIELAQAQLDQVEAREKEIEALEAEAEARAEHRAELRKTQGELGQLFLAELEVGYAADAQAEALLNAASAAGASVTDMVLLAGAAYNLSDAQIEAALKAAVMQQKITELGQNIANGETTVRGAIDELHNFQSALDQNYQIIVETGDVNAASSEVEELRTKAAETEAQEYAIKFNALGIEEVGINVEETVGAVETATDETYEFEIDADTSSAEEEIEGAVSTVGTATEDMETTVATGITNTVGIVEEGATNIVAALTSAFEEVVASAESEIPEMAAVVSKSVDDAVASGLAGVTAFRRVGFQLMEGMRLGALSGRGPLIATIRAIVRSAILAAENEAIISSPSRETMRIGEMLALGFVVGLQSEAPRVMSSVQNIVGQIIAHWNQLIDEAEDAIAEGSNAPDVPPLIELFLGSADDLARAGRTFASMFEDEVLDPIEEKLDAADDRFKSAAERLGERLEIHFEELPPPWIEVEDDSLKELQEILADPLRMDELTPELLMQEFFKAVRSGNRELSTSISQLMSAQSQRNQLEEEFRKEQERILELEEQRRNLDFLQTQFDLIRQLQEAGIDPKEILGGMELGLDASLPGLIEAMSRAMAALIDEANDELGIASPSKVFSRMGRFIYAGLEMGLDEAAKSSLSVLSGALSGLALPPVILPPLTAPEPRVIVMRPDERNFNLTLNSSQSAMSARRSFHLMEMLDG